MLTSTLNKPVIAATMGDPAGIGPEIIARSLNDSYIREQARYIIVGDGFVFDKALGLTGTDFAYSKIKGPSDINFDKCKILLLDMQNVNSKNFAYGIKSKEYGGASTQYIKEAYNLIKAKKADAMVTAPINKYSAKLSGFKYNGHTEFLAHLSKTKRVAMMLTGGPLTVVLLTTHIPINKVASSLTRDKILQSLIMINDYMDRYFGIYSPKIGVCALNPHGGEEGSFGLHEKRIIAPAIDSAKKKGLNVIGPYPADALFYKAYKGDFDVALCMYHDQGLIPLKMIARDETVNITLGLPFVRTSCGHGTAFDIAGKNKACPDSFSAAIRTAISIVGHNRRFVKK